MGIRKLRSRRGMSIVMGLLLLLVCATAGAAALTSAASNAGRYTHLRRDQQRYLAVASAARTVRDELCKGSYTATEVSDEEGVVDPAKSERKYEGSAFEPWLKDGSPASYSGLGIEVPGEDPVLSQVEWELELEEDYTLTAHFGFKDGDATYYNTTLTIPAQTEESFSLERDTSVAGQRWITTKTVSVTWPVEGAVIQQN